MAILELINEINQYDDGSVDAKQLFTYSRRHMQQASKIKGGIIKTKYFKSISNNGYQLKEITILNDRKIRTKLELVKNQNKQTCFEFSNKYEFENSIRSHVNKALDVIETVTISIGVLSDHISIENLCEDACNDKKADEDIKNIIKAIMDTNHTDSDLLRINDMNGNPRVFSTKHQFGWRKNVTSANKKDTSLVGYVIVVDDEHQRVIIRDSNNNHQKWLIYIDRIRRELCLRCQLIWQPVAIEISEFIEKWDGYHVAKNDYTIEPFNREKHSHFLSNTCQYLNIP